MFGMANLRPDETGLSLVIHVYKDEARYSKHGPRIKVFPGKPHQGNATTITIPTDYGDNPLPVGRVTISGRDLHLAINFVKRNYLALATYWYVPDFTEDSLRKELR